MNRFAASFTVLACAVTIAGTAHAATDYSAYLGLNPGLPALRTGNPGLDGPHNLDGDWTGASDPRARAFSRDQQGGGAGWGAWQGSADLHRVTGVPTGMGESVANAYLLDRNSAGFGNTAQSAVMAAGHIRNLGQSEVEASGTWSRTFSLAARSSFTFSGIAALGVTGDDAPLDMGTLFSLDPLASFCSLVVADLSNRVRAEMTAAVTSAFGGNWGDVFSYQTGPGGQISLTVTNATDSLMTGRLGAGAYVNVAAPVPEPTAIALLFAGVGVVGAAVRRQRARTAAALAA